MWRRMKMLQEPGAKDTKRRCTRREMKMLQEGTQG